LCAEFGRGWILETARLASPLEGSRALNAKFRALGIFC
jgi:hypothetical protein